MVYPSDHELLVEFWMCFDERKAACPPVDQAGKYLDHRGRLVDVRGAATTQELDEDQTLYDVGSRAFPSDLLEHLSCLALRSELRSLPAGHVSHGERGFHWRVVVLGRKW